MKFFLILFITSIVVVGFIFGTFFIKDLTNESRRKSYVGTWKLQTNNKLVYYETKYEDIDVKDKYHTIKHEIIIDDILEITDENAYYGMSLSSCGYNKDDPSSKWGKRCPKVPTIVRLNTNDKVVAINFIDTEGDGYLLCFERNEDVISQIKCGTSNSDEFNTEVLYTMMAIKLYMKIKKRANFLIMLILYGEKITIFIMLVIISYILTILNLNRQKKWLTNRILF